MSQSEKKIHAGNASAGIAIGRNIESIGATTWAVGHNLFIQGNFSTGLGYNGANTEYLGSFVYGDNSTIDTVFNTADNQFMVRAAGGYVFYTSADLSMGVEATAGGGSWEMISDSTKKEGVKLLFPGQYTERYLNLPIYQWQYTNYETPHIGPMAQDMYGIFRVGEKPTYINMLDSDGIALLGIKMLIEKLDELPQEDELLDLKKESEEVLKDFLEIEERLNLLYEKMD
jgi:hypothetical protein